MFSRLVSLGLLMRDPSEYFSVLLQLASISPILNSYAFATPVETSVIAAASTGVASR
ncbi:hypothetical protein D9M68_972200 [compost metagenome]